MKTIKLIPKDKDKVKATYSQNAPGIKKKKTLINEGGIVDVKRKVAVLPRAGKENGIRKSLGRTDINKNYNKLVKITQKPKVANKIGQAIKDNKSTSLSQSELKASVGGRKAKKIMKYAEGSNRLLENTKSMYVGNKDNKHYQSALKKK